MSVPEQWRFQWPDGTWIRWNPQTQSWEKEPPGGDASDPGAGSTPVDVADLPDVAPSPAADPVPAPVVDPDAGSDDRPAGDRSEGDDTELWAAERVPEEQPYVVPRPGSPAGRRQMVGDVLPQPDTELPRVSVWPAVITGMVVGVGIGVIVLNSIR